ncbi:MAG: PIN domain-containing protein [Xanthobacteraceae bacterium]
MDARATLVLFSSPIASQSIEGRYFSPRSIDILTYRRLLGQPNCQIIEPADRHWDIFRRLCIDTNTRGSTVSDAWYAALAIESGCEWITLDHDFARFPGLRWRLPD